MNFIVKIVLYLGNFFKKRRCKQKTFFLQNTLLKIIISYDTKKGIFGGVNIPKWLIWNYNGACLAFQIVNNPVEIISEKYPTLIEYLEFNSNDYPTKIKVDRSYEIEIKYIECK